MQLIQRTSCPDRQRSSSDYLAGMIDRKTRDHDLHHAGSDGRPGGVGTSLQALESNVLIWVERDGGVVREPCDGRLRGILIAAHGSRQGSTDGSFIISYPIGEGDHAPHVPAVSGLLEALGWSIVASRHESTAKGDVNLALLVSTAATGQERRLWLTESVGGAPAIASETRIGIAAIRDQIETWVNEGGAGDDVAA